MASYKEVVVGTGILNQISVNHKLKSVGSVGFVACTALSFTATSPSIILHINDQSTNQISISFEVLDPIGH